MEYVMPRNLINGSTAGNGVLCGSAMIVMLCNNRGIVGSSVLFLARAARAQLKKISGGGSQGAWRQNEVNEGKLPVTE
jgi:hypothetical protein